MTAIEVLVLTAAVWRITSLLTDEAGPWNMFGRLRSRLGVRFEHGHRIATTELGALFLCVWCLSPWIGVAVTILYFSFPTQTFWIAVPLAMSAAAIMANEWLDEKSRPAN